jgi:iron complex outermembrane receptor protein/vitamin B12 transporter
VDTSRTRLVNNRDELVYQGDYRITPHLAALAGFRYENERGAEVYNAYSGGFNIYSINDSDERTNTVYLAAVHGDFLNRFYYNAGGSLEHYSLFGTQTSPHAGLSYYLLRPRSGNFNGTRLFGDFGDAVREPKLTDKFGSLYQILLQANEQASIAQFHVTPLAAPTTRSYEGGVEQAFLGQHLVFRADYFHNQFGRELEPVSTGYLSALFPDYSAAQLQTLTAVFKNNSVYDLMCNTQAFRAQGAEATLESGLGSFIFLRGGYTYTDAVVQRSFTSDNQALLGGWAPTFNGIPIGAGSPLVGARPFRRPPHTGFFTATFQSRKMTGIFNAAFAGRSDDSTFLAYSDAQGGNSLLLPNRNLDHGYAKLDMGGSYQWSAWFSSYLQMENLLDNQHIAPIGYAGLPFTVRSGIRLALGKGSGR